MLSLLDRACLHRATSLVAMGKVAVKHRAGEACPPGWLIDGDGNPTTDPAVMHKGTFNEPGSSMFLASLLSRYFTRLVYSCD